MHVRMIGAVALTLLLRLLLSNDPVLLADERPNVLLVTIDDLRCDLGCFGVVHAKTPSLDALAAAGRLFTHHYVQVPTCGASRCALLRGRYPQEPEHLSNQAIVETQRQWVSQSLPAVFQQHGYRTLALGKITHYPGGLTGREWNEPPEELPGVWDRCWVPESPWETPQAMMHGYANGQARRRGQSPAWEQFDGPDEAYPDAWIADEAIRCLKELRRNDQPWLFAVGFFKPHLPLAAPKKWFDRHDPHALAVPLASGRPLEPSSWHSSGEFRRNYDHGERDPERDPEYARQIRHAYAAATSYVDHQVGRVLEALEQLDLAENTIVVVWSDHGFLLGEHAIWGKHCLYENALRSPLIIRTPQMPQPGQPCEEIVESVDLFPTLCELCSLPAPGDLDGISLLPQLQDASAPTRKPALSFWTGGQRSVRTEGWRLIEHEPREQPSAAVELYDMQRDPQETRNVGPEHPDIVTRLRSLLRESGEQGRGR